jgi:hypothetical protein
VDEPDNDDMPAWDAGPDNVLLPLGQVVGYLQRLGALHKTAGGRRAKGLQGSSGASSDDEEEIQRVSNKYLRAGCRP